MTQEIEQLRQANTQLGQVILDKDAEISALKDQNSDASNRETMLRKALTKTSNALQQSEATVKLQVQEINHLKGMIEPSEPPKKERKPRAK